jgi:hypothetical protein
MKVMQIYSLHGHEYGGLFLQPSSPLLHLEEKLTVSQKSYDGCNFLLINISIYNIPINRKEFDKQNENILHVQTKLLGNMLFVCEMKCQQAFIGVRRGLMNGQAHEK